MSLQIGIVGLPNVGKSTLFNALTKKGSAAASNFPFTTIDPNVGIVDLPDNRLEKLAEIVVPERIVPASVTFVDIAGLVRGASAGEGLGNKFLANIREVDAIAMVLRDFTDPNVTHVAGAIQPVSDAEIIHTELALKDLETVTKSKSSAEGKARTGDKTAAAYLAALTAAEAALEEGRAIRTLSPTDCTILEPLQLLTAKPILYVLNVDEDRLSKATDRIAELRISAPDLFGEYPIVPISAKIEAELVELTSDEQLTYLAELGLEEPGLNRLIREAFTLLNLQTYFTAGPKEVRAWTVPIGATAPQAAGVIHTDFERGFIRAEVIAYNDYIALGGEMAAKTAGKLRSEGKDYIVQDGDVVHFRFNV